MQNKNEILPHEILVNIFDKLAGKELQFLSVACKEFCSIINDTPTLFFKKSLKAKLLRLLSRLIEQKKGNNDHRLVGKLSQLYQDLKEFDLQRYQKLDSLNQISNKENSLKNMSSKGLLLLFTIKNKIKAHDALFQYLLMMSGFILNEIGPEEKIQLQNQFSTLRKSTQNQTEQGVYANCVIALNAKKTAVNYDDFFKEIPEQPTILTKLKSIISWG